MLLIIAVGALTFTSCSSDDDGGSSSSSKNCERLVEDTQNAAQNYVNDNSRENCIAYKKAVKAFLKSGCSGSAYNEDLLDDLDCDQ